ncbi:MAG: FAD-dependent monooxygenase [Actinomycetales bacterium]|nr:FAD-dependent monooxygenase [Actinomycetales bacterium]
MNRTNASDQHIAVLVVGAGPVGLTLALELNRYGILTLLVDKSVTTTRHRRWTSPTRAAWSSIAGSASLTGCGRSPCPPIAA